MGKTKNDKKKREAADPQLMGPNETEKPVSTPPNPDQPETGADQSQDPQRKAKVSPFGDAASEGDKKPKKKSAKPLADSKEAQKPVVKVQSSPSPPPAQGNNGLSAKEELPEEKIDELVHRVIANRDKADNAQLETGQMLLDEVFGGSLKEALSRSPKKQKSFEKICDHPDMDVDSTTLSRWVKAANLVKSFEMEGKKFENLTCSHYIALLALKKRENTIRLAEEAEKNQFSVRRLALEVFKAEPPPPKKLVDEISSKLESVKAVLDDDSVKKKLTNKTLLAAKLTATELERLLKDVGLAKARAQKYLDALGNFQALLKDIEKDGKSKGK